MHRAIVIRTLLTGESQRGGFEPHLIAVDRVLQRWVVAISGGLPTDVWDDSGVARPPPLDNECAILVDRLVLAAPRRKRRVITYWYRKPWPTNVVASKLGVSDMGLYLELRAALDYARLKMLATQQRTLVELLKVRGE